MSTVAERGPPPTREGPSREAQAVLAPEASFPIRRHPGDVLRVVVGGTLLALSAAIASTERVGTLERDLFRLVNHLPSALEVPLIGVMQAGAIAAVPACAAIALVANRRRLARDLAVSGTTAWLLAKVVKDIVSRARPDALLSDVIVRHAGNAGLGLPSGHAAVAAALATAAGPFLPRRARHATWLIVALVSAGRVYVGSHLPDDVLGGMALGWMIGAAWHLAVGAPARGVTAGRVALSAGDRGVVAGDGGAGPCRRPRVGAVRGTHLERTAAVRQGRRPRAPQRRPAVQAVAVRRPPPRRGRGTLRHAQAAGRARGTAPPAGRAGRRAGARHRHRRAVGVRAGAARAGGRARPTARRSRAANADASVVRAPSGGRWIASIVRGSPTATCGPRTCSSAATGNRGSSTSGSRSCRPATAGWRRTSPS